VFELSLNVSDIQSSRATLRRRFVAAGGDDAGELFADVTTISRLHGMPLSARGASLVIGPIRLLTATERFQPFRAG
jgi:hypothetical protein